MNSTNAQGQLSVAVVGAGITGLVAAQGLAAHGHKVTLLERSLRTGGSIGTDMTEGWLVERGPNSILDGDLCVQQLIDRLGLREQVLGADERAKKRFIVRGGRLQALPSSPVSLLTTRLFSLRTRLGIFKELFQGPRERPEDVSLAELVRDHFGQEAVDYGLNPFVGGIYAGDPNLLSAQHSFPALWKGEREKGSLIRGMMAAGKQRKARGGRRGKIVSFKAGLQSLTDALVARLPEGCLRLGVGVHSVRGEAGSWLLGLENQGSHLEERFDRVLFALPAHALARISFPDKAAHGLSEVIHPPVSSLFLGYQRSQVAHPLDGFGALVPAVEGLSELGILFSSSLFPGRAPEGHVALTVMVGGMRQPELARLSTDQLLQRLQPELESLLGVTGAPCFVRHNTWPQAIPQYNLGYERHMDHFDRLEQTMPGLLFGGNARDGISVPNCISAGLRLVERVCSPPNR